MKLGKVEIAIMQKLYDHDFIGEKHTSEDNVPKGFLSICVVMLRKPSRILFARVMLPPKITSYGLEVSLDPRRLAEIRKLLSAL